VSSRAIAAMVAATTLLLLPSTAHAWGQPNIEIRGNCDVVYTNSTDTTTRVNLHVRSDGQPMGDLVVEGGPQTVSIAHLIPPGLHDVTVIASNADAKEKTVEATFKGLKCKEAPSQPASPATQGTPAASGPSAPTAPAAAPVTAPAGPAATAPAAPASAPLAPSAARDRVLPAQDVRARRRAERRQRRERRERIEARRRATQDDGRPPRNTG
jgi:hypothetical protein